MLITRVTIVSSGGSDDNVVIKISHGIVVKMTTKIFTVQAGVAGDNSQNSMHLAASA